MSFYFPFFWILSIIFYVLFFVHINRFEKKYNLIIERYSGNRFPKIKVLKRILKGSSDKMIIKGINKALTYLYLSRASFAAPILVYFFEAIFT